MNHAHLSGFFVCVFFTLTDRASTPPSNIRRCQFGTWSQKGTKVNGPHHRDKPLLKPAGIQIATKPLPGPTTRGHREHIGVKTIPLGANYSFYYLGGIPWGNTRFSLSMENEQADAGRDGRTHLAGPKYQARTGTGKKTFFLFRWSRAGLATLPGWSILCYMRWPYIHISTCPLHTNSGRGKKRRILTGPWWPPKAAPVRNYLKVYWPCAGGLSAVNVIGT